jgi:hypothetical protein
MLAEFFEHILCLYNLCSKTVGLQQTTKFNFVRVHLALQVFLVLKWRVRLFLGLLDNLDLQEKLEL